MTAGTAAEPPALAPVQERGLHSLEELLAIADASAPSSILDLGGLRVHATPGTQLLRPLTADHLTIRNGSLYLVGEQRLLVMGKGVHLEGLQVEGPRTKAASHVWDLDHLQGLVQV